MSDKNVISEVEDSTRPEKPADMMIPWPDPSPEELKTLEFEAVWQAIKTWDINVPEAYSGYCGATGNHVKVILDALRQIERGDFNMEKEKERISTDHALYLISTLDRPYTISHRGGHYCCSITDEHGEEISKSDCYQTFSDAIMSALHVLGRK